MHVDIYNLMYISNRRKLLRGKRNFSFLFSFFFLKGQKEKTKSLLLYSYSGGMRQHYGFCN